MTKRNRKASRSQQPIQASDAVAELCLSADLTIHAAAGEGDIAKARRFDMVAYTGAPMKLRGYRTPVVVDLAGLNVPSQNRPILLDHASDVDSIAGQSDSIGVIDGKLRVAGEILAGTNRIDNVLSLASRGFKWQASIGANPERVEELRAGETALVNGQEVRGPLAVVRQATLREISIVAMGADDRTDTRIAATAAPVENQEMAIENEKIEAEATTTAPVAATAAPAVDLSDVKAALADLQREIVEMKLSNVRDSRPAAPAVHVENAEPTLDVLEAAVCSTLRLDVEKDFSEKTLEASEKFYRRGLGLQELLIEAARINGYRGRAKVGDDTLPDLLQAAFSTHSISGLLSNIAHKSLLQAYQGVEQSWRSIASVRSVSDFKLHTSYRLLGGKMEFQKVGDGGELKHAEVGEQSYTNQADTFGRMINITRKQMIDDDLSSLSAIPAQLGRGAAIAFNKTFWSEFLADAGTFYTTARGNYFTGADSALSIDSLTKAERLFMEQTDPDGNPLAIMPSLLLVPPALFTPANVLMNSTEVRDTTASNKYGIANPHAGKFSVVNSVYLNNANVSGGSATAWYLLANSMDVSVIEVAFLNGNESPIVEQAQANFNTLGISMRGYWDWGVKKQEYRAAVKSKGAA